MKIFYQNARGLRTKTKEFLQAVRLNNFDVICLTETWLNGDYFSHELFDERYVVIRRDRCKATYKRRRRRRRKNLRGGGVCVAVRKSEFKAIHQADWQSESVEDIWVTLIDLKEQRTHLNCAYIPGVTTTATFDSFFNGITERVTSLANDKVLILGDQNVPEFFNSSLPRGSKFDSLNELIDLCGLTQLNSIPNRLSNTVLDLIFANHFLHVCEAYDPLVKSDLFHLHW